MVCGAYLIEKEDAPTEPPAVVKEITQLLLRLRTPVGHRGRIGVRGGHGSSWARGGLGEIWGDMGRYGEMSHLSKPFGHHRLKRCIDKG